MTSKCCSRCGEWKPLDAFNVSRTRPLGRQSRCKSCQIISNREWAERTRNRTYSPKWRGHGATPESIRASKTVERALKSGKLTRPECCERCGEAPGVGRAGQSLIYAHHEDYSKPFVIEWLCARCHARHHWLSVTV